MPHRLCSRCCGSARASDSAANGRGQHCWPPRPQRRASAPGLSISYVDFLGLQLISVLFFAACVFLILGMALMGLTFGPMSAILPELFPTNVRYTGSGIAYNVASILGAAVAPFIATWLVADFGVAWVGVYLAVAGVLTLLALWSVKETRSVDLSEV